jgi:hypothetical protein
VRPSVAAPADLASHAVQGALSQAIHSRRLRRRVLSRFVEAAPVGSTGVSAPPEGESRSALGQVVAALMGSCNDKIRAANGDALIPWSDFVDRLASLLGTDAPAPAASLAANRTTGRPDEAVSRRAPVVASSLAALCLAGIVRFVTPSGGSSASVPASDTDLAPDARSLAGQVGPAVALAVRTTAAQGLLDALGQGAMVTTCASSEPPPQQRQISAVELLTPCAPLPSTFSLATALGLPIPSGGSSSNSTSSNREEPSASHGGKQQATPETPARPSPAGTDAGGADDVDMHTGSSGRPPGVAVVMASAAAQPQRQPPVPLRGREAPELPARNRSGGSSTLLSLLHVSWGLGDRRACSDVSAVLRVAPYVLAFMRPGPVPPASSISIAYCSPACAWSLTCTASQMAAAF